MKFLQIPLILSIVLLSSCYRNSTDVYLEDLDIVVTAYDETYDFKSAQTFELPDSIVNIGGGRKNDQYNQLILDQVRQNLLNTGLTEEPDPQANGADLAVVIHTISVDNYVVTNPYSFYDYWGWYGWYPPYGYGPGYGMYYPYPVVVDSYTTGTILMIMFDPEKPGAQPKQIPIVWSGIINGVIDGEIPYLRDRIRKGIDQSFDQSPYLWK